MEQFLRYFCGDAADSQGLVETEPLRISFYKSVATFVRAYAEIAQDLTTAGYSDADDAALQKEVEFYGDIRAGIKRHSGEELDIKPYEADMRRLLSIYVQADPAANAGNFSSLSLTDLTIKTGIHDAIARKLIQKGKLLMAADPKAPTRTWGNVFEEIIKPKWWCGSSPPTNRNRRPTSAAKSVSRVSPGG
jgi:type I restriction enzyme R subunit